MSGNPSGRGGPPEPESRFDGSPELLDGVVFEGLLDYAGLYPPAALPMNRAVEGFLAVARSPDHPALGRLIVGYERLGELEAEVEARQGVGGEVEGACDPLGLWALSVTAGREFGPARDAIRELNAHHAGRSGGSRLQGPVRAVEARVDSTATLDDCVAAFAELDSDPSVYVEIPVEGDVAPLLHHLARLRTRAPHLRAKIRTGGITAEAFPSVDQVGRFLVTCRDLGVPCKATAGLHHALPGLYPLTYEPLSPQGRMHGLFNLVLAAGLACVDFAGQGMAGWEEIAALLAECDAGAFGIVAGARGEAAVRWRDRSISEAALAAGRTRLLRRIGTCSFTEPVEHLKHLGIDPIPRNRTGMWIPR